MKNSQRSFPPLILYFKSLLTYDRWTALSPNMQASGVATPIPRTSLAVDLSSKDNNKKHLTLKISL